MFNPFHATGIFLSPWKPLVFWCFQGDRKIPVAWIGLKVAFFPENKTITPEKWNFCVWYTTLVLKKYRKENWLTSILSFGSSIKGKVWSLVFLYLLFSYNFFYLVLREFQYSKTNETQNVFARLFDV